MMEAALEAFYGFSKVALGGKIYQTDFPSPSTCWRRLLELDDAGVFLEMWHAFIDELSEQGRMSWDELFIDGSFASAKKGAKTSEKPGGERVQSGWWWLMAREYLWHAPRTRPKGLR
jgi:hypothetical protein